MKAAQAQLASKPPDSREKMSRPGLFDVSSGLALTPREPISVFVVTFNEERNIAACLESVSFCDEILVVDSFSTDRTVEIAKQHGARVIERAWKGYHDQKSFALSQTVHDWVLYIDADERVSHTLRKSILGVLEEEYRLRSASAPLDGRPDGYAMNRLVFHLGRWWNKGGWYPEYRVRLFRKSRSTLGGEEPHEKVVVEGRSAKLAGDIEHYTYASLSEQFSQLNSFSTLAADRAYANGRRASLFSIIVKPVLRFGKFFILRGGFKEGTAGLIVGIAEAYYTFMKYAKLWEKQLREGKQHDEARAEGSHPPV